MVATAKAKARALVLALTVAAVAVGGVTAIELSGSSSPELGMQKQKMCTYFGWYKDSWGLWHEGFFEAPC